MRDLISASLLAVLCVAPSSGEEAFRPLPLRAEITGVQPLTGLVLWTSSGRLAEYPAQLEYRYLKYDEVAVGEREDGSLEFDWGVLDRTLAATAARGRQLIVRPYYVWPGKPSTVPAFLKERDDYQERRANADGRPTWLPDWRCEALEGFTLAFFAALAERYDDDPRLAYLEVGFGLWGEYHIYDGPCLPGETFPSKAFQLRFADRLTERFQDTPWMVSIDSHDPARSPMAEDARAEKCDFGLFDDSLMIRRHEEMNATWWRAMGPDRWRRSPMGGEFNYASRRDQREMLSTGGPHGVPFASFAQRFHLTFVIANDQPRYRTPAEFEAASRRCGYRFRVTEFASSPERVRVGVINEGVAPIYYDAYPTLDGVRSADSLRGLAPGDTKTFVFDYAAGNAVPELTIECDRLVPGQRIEYAADLE